MCLEQTKQTSLYSSFDSRKTLFKSTVIKKKMLAALKLHLAPVLRNTSTAFRCRPCPTRLEACQTVIKQQQPELSPSVDTLEEQVEAGVRLLTQPDAEIPPHIAKTLVGKDGKIRKEMEPFYRELPMWGPVGLYQ
jgi:hypothetical protein